jgi:hypothetical protein
MIAEMQDALRAYHKKLEDYYELLPFDKEYPADIPHYQLLYAYYYFHDWEVDYEPTAQSECFDIL